MSETTEVTPIPRIGVGIVIRRGNEVLLLRRHNVHGGVGNLHAPDESTEVRWFPHDQLPEPLFLCFANLTQGAAYMNGHWFHR